MLRDKLIQVALEWQAKFGVAPQITTAVSELSILIICKTKLQ